MEKLSGSEPTSRVAIEKLVKKFGNKKAVNNLSMTLFKNEILVLLGHNGAGKTTTINMLTGLTKPTSGSANAIDILPGQDIDLFADYENLVDLIGVCPQEDVLISRLTVEENLQFFCLFKSIANSEHIIEEILDKYNLAAKRDTQAKSLSGG
jgi:ATP-binding cassette subfamily A (ABC1) protein 3